MVRSVGASIYLFGAREDKEACVQIEAAVNGHVINLCGATNLPALGGYLEAMDLVITVDSGPMHMAAATGTPVIAVFGATDALRTGPYGDHTVITRSDLTCRPCLSRTCRLPSRDIRCLTGLNVNPVVQAAETILAGS